MREVLKRAIQFAALGGVVLAVAGCGKDQAEVRDKVMTDGGFIARYGYDYLGHTEGLSDAAGQSCLAYTPYDTSTRTPALFLLSQRPNRWGQTVATITPNAGNAPASIALRLAGFGNTHRYLQPVDSQSAQILTSYNCDPGAPFKTE